MWYTYVLQSKKNKRLYTGSTSDLRKRVKEHNGKITRKNASYKILFYEAYLDKKDALKSEKFFKTGYGREVLKDKIKYSITNGA